MPPPPAVRGHDRPPQEREKREREQAKIQAVEDAKRLKQEEEERVRAIARLAKAERESLKKEMRRRKKVGGRECVCWIWNENRIRYDAIRSR